MKTGGSPRKPELKFTSQSSPPIPISQPTPEKLKGNGVIMLRRISAIWSGLITAVFYAFGSRILFPDQMSPLVILATSSIIGALVFYRVLTWRRGDWRPKIVFGPSSLEFTLTNKKNESRPLSYSFTKNIHWWYGAAWFTLVLIITVRWGVKGY